MMEKKKNVFDFVGSVFMIYGITITMLLFILVVIGDVNYGENLMFEMGSRGLTTKVLLQFLFLSFVNISLQYLCFSDRFIKEASNRFRTSLMLLSVLVIMAGFIQLFAWFPSGYLLPWVLYVSFFLLSYFVSILVISMKERLENKQMAEGLNRYKAKLKEEKKDV